jgi:hypothetical protein
VRDATRTFKLAKGMESIGQIALVLGVIHNWGSHGRGHSNSGHPGCARTCS